MLKFSERPTAVSVLCPNCRRGFWTCWPCVSLAADLRNGQEGQSISRASEISPLVPMMQKIKSANLTIN